MTSKKDLIKHFEGYFNDYPSLLGIKAYPVVLENGNIWVGGISEEGTIYNNLEEAVNSEVKVFVNKHYDRLSKEFNKLVESHEKKKEILKNKLQDKKYQLQIESLFSQILNSATTKDDAITTLKFMQLDEKNNNKEKVWNDNKISSAINDLINDHYKK